MRRDAGLFQQIHQCPQRHLGDGHHAVPFRHRAGHIHHPVAADRVAQWADKLVGALAQQGRVEGQIAPRHAQARRRQDRPVRLDQKQVAIGQGLEIQAAQQLAGNDRRSWRGVGRGEQVRQARERAMHLEQLAIERVLHGLRRAFDQRFR